MPLAPQAVQAGARLVSQPPGAWRTAAGDEDSLRLAQERGENVELFL